MPELRRRKTKSNPFPTFPTKANDGHLLIKLREAKKISL